jgi:hypothetical protein
MELGKRASKIKARREIQGVKLQISRKVKKRTFKAISKIISSRRTKKNR